MQLGVSVQQLAADNQALKTQDKAGSAANRFSCQCNTPKPHISADISNVSCSWGQCAAAGGEQSGRGASLGDCVNATIQNRTSQC